MKFYCRRSLSFFIVISTKILFLLTIINFIIAIEIFYTKIGHQENKIPKKILHSIKHNIIHLYYLIKNGLIRLASLSRRQIHDLLRNNVFDLLCYFYFSLSHMFDPIFALLNSPFISKILSYFSKIGFLLFKCNTADLHGF